MIKIAIVEDSSAYARQLEAYLRQYEQDFSETFDISFYNDGSAILGDFRSQFDIILMDIEMQYMDGMTAAEHIRKQDQEVVIIFITYMSQYAIRGYAVEALDYILKPVSYFAFSQRLARAIHRMKKREHKSVIIPVKGGSVRLGIQSIYYIESQGHDLIYHADSGAYVAPGTMKQTEQTLRPHHFFRGSKWYLINLQQATGFEEGNAHLKNGCTVPISRGHRKEFMEALAQYWTEVMK